MAFQHNFESEQNGEADRWRDSLDVMETPEPDDEDCAIDVTHLSIPELQELGLSSGIESTTSLMRRHRSPFPVCTVDNTIAFAREFIERGANGLE